MVENLANYLKRLTFAKRIMIDKGVIETAYCFFHQKQRVYQYSTMDWQKDDIEYAIEGYVSTMNGELYELLSGGRPDFLRNHTTFAADIVSALEMLDSMMEG